MTDATESEPTVVVVYHRYHEGTDSNAVVALETPHGQPLGVLRHIVRYSPVGLSWGYGDMAAALRRTSRGRC